MHTESDKLAHNHAHSQTYTLTILTLHTRNKAHNAHAYMQGGAVALDRKETSVTDPVS